jgi:hypothetical protein
MMTLLSVGPDSWPAGAAAGTIHFPEPSQLSGRMPRSVPDVKTTIPRYTIRTPAGGEKHKKAEKESSAGIHKDGTRIKHRGKTLGMKMTHENVTRHMDAATIPHSIANMSESERPFVPWKPPDERQKGRRGEKRRSKPVTKSWRTGWLSTPAAEASSQLEGKSRPKADRGESRQEPFNIDLGIRFRQAMRGSSLDREKQVVLLKKNCFNFNF